MMHQKVERTAIIADFPRMALFPAGEGPIPAEDFNYISMRLDDLMRALSERDHIPIGPRLVETSGGVSFANTVFAMNRRWEPGPYFIHYEKDVILWRPSRLKLLTNRQAIPRSVWREIFHECETSIGVCVPPERTGKRKH